MECSQVPLQDREDTGAACSDLRTLEADVGGLLQIQGPSGLHTENQAIQGQITRLSLTKKQNNNKKKTLKEAGC